MVETPGLLVLCTGHLQGPSTAIPLEPPGPVSCWARYFIAPTARMRRTRLTSPSGRPRRSSRRAGRVLMDSCWGRYVAFVRDSAHDTVWVVKDPVGRLPWSRGAM